MVDGKPVELTSYEFRVLEYLLTHAGKVISKSELTEHLYTEDEERDSNVIEVFIRRLRSKLDSESQYNPITTLRGSGYRWDLPIGKAHVCTPFHHALTACGILTQKKK